MKTISEMQEIPTLIQQLISYRERNCKLNRVMWEADVRREKLASFYVPVMSTGPKSCNPTQN